jgi:hypothetical protein
MNPNTFGPPVLDQEDPDVPMSSSTYFVTLKLLYLYVGSRAGIIWNGTGPTICAKWGIEPQH